MMNLFFSFSWKNWLHSEGVGFYREGKVLLFFQFWRKGSVLFLQKKCFAGKARFFFSFFLPESKVFSEKILPESKGFFSKKRFCRKGNFFCRKGFAGKQLIGIKTTNLGEKQVGEDWVRLLANLLASSSGGAMKRVASHEEGFSWRRFRLVDLNNLPKIQLRKLCFFCKLHGRIK